MSRTLISLSLFLTVTVPFFQKSEWVALTGNGIDLKSSQRAGLVLLRVDPAASMVAKPETAAASESVCWRYDGEKQEKTSK